MSHYAYRVYRNQINNPVYAGTVTAQDMDSAVASVITSCKIDVEHEDNGTFKSHRFTLRGQPVGILIYANPEEY